MYLIDKKCIDLSWQVEKKILVGEKYFRQENKILGGEKRKFGGTKNKFGGAEKYSPYIYYDLHNVIFIY